MKLSGRIKRKQVPVVILNFLKEIRENYGNVGDKAMVFMMALGMVLENSKLKIELIRRSKIRTKSIPWRADEKYFNLYICMGDYPGQHEFLLSIIKNKREYPSGALAKVLINALLLVLEKDKLKAELIKRIADSDNMLKEYRREVQREWRKKNANSPKQYKKENIKCQE
jgi:cell division protein ZapA (FtsZ GTPase activity inhibitor)